MKRRRSTVRPKVFVGSSAESLDVAYAIQENLEPDAELTVWPQGVFELSKTAVESLSRTLAKSDFGIFVFAPDDIVRLRKKTYAAVRDNVVFELGLFAGRLGIERTFVIVPRHAPNLRLPTDLASITPGRYDERRRDRNLSAALGPVCNRIRKSMKALTRARRRRRKASPKPPPPGSVIIQRAQYGGAGHWTDVRGVLMRQLQRGKWRIMVGNQLGADPAPGKEKLLRLQFSHGGRRFEASVPEGRAFSFPG